MRLDAAALARFEADGFLILPGVFAAAEIAHLTAELPALFAEDCPENVREKQSGVVRTAMALHRRNPLYARLVRDPRLLGPAAQLLGEPFYVQQVKVNAKEAFTGEVWQWHYDFATHHGEDGVPAPRALNLHILLDEVGPLNGPLIFLPGSQRHGPAPTSLDRQTTSYPLWTVDRRTVAELAAERGMVAAKGPPGTLLIFGDCLVHGSPANLSPWPRRIFSLIVNPVANAATRQARPDHQHHRDLTPVTALAESFAAAVA